MDTQRINAHLIGMVELEKFKFKNFICIFNINIIVRGGRGYVSEKAKEI